MAVERTRRSPDVDVVGMLFEPAFGTRAVARFETVPFAEGGRAHTKRPVTAFLAQSCESGLRCEVIGGPVERGERGTGRGSFPDRLAQQEPAAGSKERADGVKRREGSTPCVARADDDGDVAPSCVLCGVGAFELDAVGDPSCIRIASRTLECGPVTVDADSARRGRVLENAEQEFGPATTEIDDGRAASGSSVPINSVAWSDDSGALKSSSVYQERSAEPGRRMCRCPPRMMESPSWMSLRCCSNSTVVSRPSR